LATSADDEVVLLDTSAAIALTDPDHVLHDAVFAAVSRRPRGLAGHAVFETYSVLTRRPPPRRMDAAVARGLLEANFPKTRYLGAGRAATLVSHLADLGVSGGAVYDALVAAAGAEADLLLISCDRRAAATYRVLGIRHQLVGATPTPDR
jgi:predicted nucleic acid-binding protein